MANRAIRTVTLLDYGVGNLRSVERALEAAGARVIRSEDVDVAAGGALVLPGVGAFRAAKERLGARFMELRQYIDEGRPLLGICLGMQLLFERSFEHGEHEGLGAFAGTVEALPAHVVVPHMGWSQISTGEVVYFCHSFGVRALKQDRGPADGIGTAVKIATVDHGGAWTASVQRENVQAFQFHPEKSGPTGLLLLRRWLDRAFAETP